MILRQNSRRLKKGDVIRVKAEKLDILRGLIVEKLHLQKAVIVDDAVEVTVRNGKEILPRIMEVATANQIYVHTWVGWIAKSGRCFLALYRKNNSSGLWQGTAWLSSNTQEGYKMTELRGFYTLWLREVKRYLRDRTRIVSSFVHSLLWLVIFGIGIGAALGIQNYQAFIFPGIVGQTLLFTSMFMGISVIWDREFGFMKEILVAPVSRLSIFLGKMIGDSTDAMIHKRHDRFRNRDSFGN